MRAGWWMNRLRELQGRWKPVLCRLQRREKLLEMLWLGLQGGGDRKDKGANILTS